LATPVLHFLGSARFNAELSKLTPWFIFTNPWNRVHIPP
jgi:hypothetical protein